MFPRANRYYNDKVKVALAVEITKYHSLCAHMGKDDERLYSAITKLEPHQQKLIRQMFFEGRSYTDIARSEGLDESAVRHATTRTLKVEKIFVKNRPNLAILWPICERCNDTLLSERKKVMQHNLKISVSKDSQSTPRSLATSPPIRRTPVAICAETI